MLEWAIISAELLPHIKAFAQKRLETLAEKSGDSFLQDAYRRLLPDATLEAANQTFFKRFSLELETSDLKTFAADQTSRDLTRFLSNPSVQALIQAPLDGQSPLDPHLLENIWHELLLIPLSPDFRWQKVADSHRQALIQQGLAKGDLRAIHLKLAELAEGIRHGPGLIPNFDTSAYLHRVNQDYGNLKLYQLHTASADDVVKLRDIFVPQGVRESLPPSDIPQGHRDRLRSQIHDPAVSDPYPDADPAQPQSRYLSLPVRPALEAAADPTALRTVILGGPGSGKSSLLQYLTLQAAAGAPDQPVPLLIELGKYVRDPAEPHTILEFLDSGDFALFHLNQRDLDSALADGRAALLLDGLDEIFERARYTAAIAEIKRLSVAYPKARILVTSRIVGYQSQLLTDAGFRHFTLQDFDPAQIDDFLFRWHRLINLPEHEKQSRYTRLRKAISDSPAIRELARNPLILTMLALVNRTREIPRERVKAYEVISELLLHHWEFERGLAPDDPDLRPDSIGLDEKLSMARLVAFDMQQAPEGLAGNLIAKDRLEEILSDYLASIRGVMNPKSLARRIIDRLHSRDAILSFAGADSYRFVHRTFLEYFCASEFNRQAIKLDKGFDWLLDETVRKHWQDETWQEVIRLICGLSGETKTARIVDFLLAQNTYPARGANILLAARCLTELRQFTALEQLSEVRRQLARLFDFEIVRVSYGRFAYPEDEKREADVRQAALALHVALADAPETARGMLENLADAAPSWWTRQYALQELSRNWPDDPAVLKTLQSCAEFDESPDVRRTALQEITRGWPNHPEALRFIKMCIRVDEHPAVRQAAILELGRLCAAGPEYKPAFQYLAAFSESPNERQAALQALAQAWPAHPDTRAWLISRADSDEHQDVRSAAVQELGRLLPLTPDTLEWLKTRVRGLDHPDVLTAALQAIARGWPLDPETPRLLLESATRPGEFPDVQAAALRELARGWPSQPGLHEALKSCASAENVPPIRIAAMRELVRVWPADPETFRIVKAAIDSETNDEVRVGALREVALAWPAHPYTLHTLKSLAQTDNSSEVRWTALQELARSHAADSDIPRILRASAMSDPDHPARWTALLQLARAAPSDPAALAQLKSNAESDKGGELRRIAVQEIARAWASDPDTLPWLKSRASSDENYEVRQAAVTEVARGWPLDPDTLPWLKALAEKEGKHSIRRAAVEELAAGWPDDPDTLRIVKSRAVSDDFSDVRSVALRELARRWPSDPITPGILKTLILSDESSDVRQVAIHAISRRLPRYPETQAVIRYCAETDESSRVRSIALRALARLSSFSPQSISVLKSGAQSDRNPNVRRDALTTLTRLCPADPATRDLLHALCQTDPDPMVRRYAEQSLERLSAYVTA